MANEIQLLEAKFKKELEEAIEAGGPIDLGHYFIQKGGKIYWRASNQKIGESWQKRLERAFGDINKAKSSLHISSTKEVRTVDSELLKPASALASMLGDLFEVEFYNAMIDEARKDPLRPIISQETQMKGFGSKSTNYNFTQSDILMVRSIAKIAAAQAYPKVRKDVFSIVGMGGSQKTGDVRVNGIVFELKLYSKSSLSGGIKYFSLTDKSNFKGVFSDFLLNLGDPYWNLTGKQLSTNEWVDIVTTDGFEKYLKTGTMTGTKHNEDTLRYLLQKGNTAFPLQKKQIITAVKYSANAVQVGVDLEALIGELSNIKFIFDSGVRAFVISGIVNKTNQEINIGKLSIDKNDITKHSHGKGENTRGWPTTFYLTLKNSFTSLGLS